VKASLLILAAALALTGCGKKGPPTRPGPADEIIFPRQYPTAEPHPPIEPADASPAKARSDVTPTPAAPPPTEMGPQGPRHDIEDDNFGMTPNSIY
jgi:predicted small lipoprotein YifL